MAQENPFQAAGVGQQAIENEHTHEYMDPDAVEDDGSEEENGDEMADGGDTSEADEELDRQEYGIYQCLPVEPGEPNWEEEEPQTVEEYLRRVRYEARHLPDVVTRPPPTEHSQQHAADAPHSQQQVGQQEGERQRRERVQGREHYGSCYLAADTGVQPCDPHLKPSAAWTRDFLHHFAQLRRRLQREYELTSGQAAAAAGGSGPRLSPQLAAGAAPTAAVQAELEELRLDAPSACMPELQQLQGLDQLQVRRQLHAAIREAVSQQQVDAEVAAQLYALSARIEKPLHAGTCALYRQLLRLCAAQRAAVSDAADPLLPHLNILITVAGAFFGQDEELSTMWDEEEE